MVNWPELPLTAKPFEVCIGADIDRAKLKVELLYHPKMHIYITLPPPPSQHSSSSSPFHSVFSGLPFSSFWGSLAPSFQNRT